jgi:outer membrane protein OmpA-like peptidoglycan-associated protein
MFESANDDLFETSNHSFDLSISDLMSALLMIFILILMVALVKITTMFEEKGSVAERYQSLQFELYDDLYEEFQDDLDDWGAEIDKETLTIRFKEPNVLFNPNSATLRPQFVEILKSFFPRYLDILYQEKYRNSIEEIKIEGHTANPGGGYPFLDGMLLSQARTNSVLRYVLRPKLITDLQELEWCQLYLTSNGMSHSRPMLDDKGAPDWNISRRVEFRVKTNAEKELMKLLEIK